MLTNDIVSFEQLGQEFQFLYLHIIIFMQFLVVFCPTGNIFLNIQG